MTFKNMLTAKGGSVVLGEVSHLTNGDTDKVETCIVVFTSVFNTDDGPWDARNSVLEDNDWGDDDKLPAESELV